MKGSPKTWIIGLLVVGAAVYLGWQIYAVHRSRAAARNGTGPALAAGVTNAAAMTGTNDLPLPVQDLDQDYAGSHWAGWVESPKRDPFLLIKPVVAAPPRTNFFVHFVLKAIWRQNGASLAAINDGVYRLGDSLDEYRVQSIGDQGVWLEVNSHKEFISFDVPGPDSEPEGGPQPEPEPAQPGVGAPGSAGPDTTNLVHSAQTALQTEKAVLDSANEALRATDSGRN